MGEMAINEIRDDIKEIKNKQDEHEEKLNQHDEKIGELEKFEAAYNKMCEIHCSLLDKSTNDIIDLKIDSAKYSTKLDLTNKILGAIAGMIGTGIVGFFFAILTGKLKL